MDLIFTLLLGSFKTIFKMWERMMALMKTQIKTWTGNKIVVKELDASINGGGMF